VLQPGTEYWLNVRFTLAADTSWASRGHVVAWAQLALPWKAAAPAMVSAARMPALRCDATPTALTIAGEDFSLAFDATRGNITAWKHAGRPIVNAGPRLQLFRAPTDNDRGFGARYEQEWRKHWLHRLQHRLEAFAWRRVAPALVEVRVHSYVAPPVVETGYTCVYVYRVYGSGDVMLEVHMQPRGPQPAVLPRVGVELTLPGRCDNIMWYGRGPGESYLDTHEAAWMDVFRCGVDAWYTPYIFPQENGNRSAVRWASFTDMRGCGLFVAGQPTLEMSAHRYTVDDFDRARHRHELTAREDITLHLDYRQNGIGSASCGPALLPQHVLTAEECCFGMRLRAFDANAIGACALSKVTPAAR